MVISAARREVAARRIAAGSELQRASLARRELEARDVRLRFEQCDARVLIDNAMLPFRSQALGRAIRLRSVVPIGLAVHADPERIQQVLQLLLSVALRSARIGGEITTVVQTVDGWIRFSVGDSGPNSIPDEVTHLFDGELSHAGTGGAPVLSRKLVEAHHGQMGVDTSPGRGHTFWFALPNQPTLLT
jgi:signal transduction histidine kinase